MAGRLGRLFGGQGSGNNQPDDSEHSVLDSPSEGIPTVDIFDDCSTNADTISSMSSMADLLRTSSADLQGSSSSPGATENSLPASVSVAESPGTDADTVVTMATGRQLLTQTLEQVKRSLEELTPPVTRHSSVLEPKQSAKLRSSYIKNLIIISLGFFCIYTAFFALRNLQSSINHNNGLGLISLSCVYASFVLGCFFAATIVPKMRPKYVILWACFGHIIYTGANFYPTFISLLPASLLLGLSMSHLWTAQGTYITSLAITYAAVTAKPPEHVLGLFNGFFLFVLQIAHILGNLLASAVFTIELGKYGFETPLMDTYDPADTGFLVLENSTIYPIAPANLTSWNLPTDFRGVSTCGSSYEHSMDIPVAPGSVAIHQHMVVVLLAIFAALNIVGIFIMSFFLDKLDVILQKGKNGASKHFLGLLTLHKDRKMVMLVPFMVYLGVEEAFVYGEVTKAFVTCPLGIHMVGYAMVCFSACNSFTSFVIGHLQALLGRVVIMTAGGVLNLALLVLLYTWEPQQSEADMAVVFVLIGALGICDGIWQTQACSLCGLLFHHEKEAAFASLRMYEALGFCITFAYATLFTIDVKLIINSIVLIMALAGFYSMELSSRRQRRDSITETESTVEFV